jgi:hypothetical protein
LFVFWRPGQKFELDSLENRLGTKILRQFRLASLVEHEYVQ